MKMIKLPMLQTRTRRKPRTTMKMKRKMVRKQTKLILIPNRSKTMKTPKMTEGRNSMRRMKTNK
jgi:hypothetical protein